MVIRDLLREATAALKQGGCDNAVFEAHWILRTVLEMSPIALFYKAGKRRKMKK